MKKKENWLSIIDYSSYKKISISSVRRRIKSNQVLHKLIEGKYYILVSNYINPDLEQIKIIENNNLKQKLRTLIEENNELKMLVTIYEKNKCRGYNEEISNIPAC